MFDYKYTTDGSIGPLLASSTPHGTHGTHGPPPATVLRRSDGALHDLPSPGPVPRSCTPVPPSCTAVPLGPCARSFWGLQPLFRTPAGCLSRLEDRRHPSAGWAVEGRPRRRRRRSTLHDKSLRTFSCTMTRCVTLQRFTRMPSGEEGSRKKRGSRSMRSTPAPRRPADASVSTPAAATGGCASIRVTSTPALLASGGPSCTQAMSRRTPR